ncbi:hypothetical protein K3G63_04840 [Hymenobacter sp. HSC-4F20]|uniref:hypothetical protein n=1 Tax=Hymenobacter sp. HSC-4F20 TaxID=2864135 RepID=UPI001C72E9ED|nr:hypothetical protein [Hymenobacter sp. HSC-4F20]MBX0289751.1 hypothetical protein [Hymenobacter sp. HSC-4F20]
MPKQAPATKADKLNSLYKECGLIKEDVFQHQHYTILTRSGIEKVQAHYGIQVSYKALKLEPKYAVIKAVAKMDEATVETYGSAVPENCKNSYFAETAEKRALSRAVLKLTGLYQHGFFGEEESEQLTAEAKAAPQHTEASLFTDALNRLRQGDAPGSVWKAYPELHGHEDFKAAVKAEAERRKATTG